MYNRPSSKDNSYLPVIVVNDMAFLQLLKQSLAWRVDCHALLTFSDY